MMMPVRKSPIRLCTEHSREGEVGADEVNKNVFLNPQTFDEVVNRVAGYRFENGGKDGWNALGSASAKGNVKVVRYILTQGDPKKLVNLGNRFGCTPLYCAFDQIKDTRILLRVAKELIQNGADVNVAVSSSSASFKAGDTPLTVAAEKLRNIELVKFLIRNGASTEVNLSENARKLVEKAVHELQTNKKPQESVQICRDQSEECETAHRVVRSIDKNTTPENFDDVMMMEPEYSLNQGSYLGYNALSVASYNGNINLVRHILKIGNPQRLINLGDVFGNTPLVATILLCEDPEALLKVAKVLIRSGADVNLAIAEPSGSNPNITRNTRKGDTPLSLAAEDPKNYKLVKLLIKNGANTSIYLTPEARKLVEKAENEIEYELKQMKKRQMTFQAGARKNPSSSLSVLPADVRRIIAHKIHKADKDAFENE